MQLKRKIQTSLLLIILGFGYTNAQNPDPVDILKQTVAKNNDIKTLRYHAIMNERIGSKMVLKDSYFKINSSPLKIYVSQSFLGIKLDALYVSGWNKNQLLVATVGFPWVQLSLDPYGKTVRDNHHHTIFEAGFNYFSNIIDQILKNYLDEVTIQYQGTNNIYGNECYKIKIEVNNYKIITYTVKNGETLTSIAKQRLINDYKILDLNPDIDNYTDVKPGQVIKIPNLYAKTLILSINKSTMLPSQIELYDEKGLYATYGYKDVIINKPFDSDEFSPTYKGYHFR
jgi:outer membrane lipoprotein-sorting protein